MVGDDPREAEADRRARRMPASPWLVVGLIALLGAAVYVASAVLA
ncbi:hypothetical protein [Brevundimonas sp.]|nr:hypothetical protein [Brevundimonas sp.]